MARATPSGGSGGPPPIKSARGSGSKELEDSWEQAVLEAERLHAAAKGSQEQEAQRRDGDDDLYVPSTTLFNLSSRAAAALNTGTVLDGWRVKVVLL